MTTRKLKASSASALLIALTATAIAAPAVAYAQHGEEAAVRRAALDYLEGFYEGDASKLRRSVRPEVVKYGFYRDAADKPYAGDAMTFEQMIAYADRVKERGRQRPDSDPKEVEILDILDQTATVKVTAFWGTDYLQLATYDGKWMILHVLWQSADETTS